MKLLIVMEWLGTIIVGVIVLAVLLPSAVKYNKQLKQQLNYLKWQQTCQIDQLPEYFRGIDRCDLDPCDKICYNPNKEYK